MASARRSPTPDSPVTPDELRCATSSSKAGAPARRDRGPARKRFVLRDEVALLEEPPEPPPSVVVTAAAVRSVVWDRRLLADVFEFEYVWDLFFPPEKRRFGWYVLPVLFRDRFVGRIEPKIGREAGRVEVIGFWWEEGFAPVAPTASWTRCAALRALPSLRERGPPRSGRRTCAPRSGSSAAGPRKIAESRIVCPSQRCEWENSCSGDQPRRQVRPAQADRRRRRGGRGRGRGPAWTLTQVNGWSFALGVVEGEFHWHKHDDEDEFFLVLEGELHGVEDAATIVLGVIMV